MVCASLLLQALLFSLSVYHANGVEKEVALAEKVEELSALAAAEPIMSFNSEKFFKYVNTSPRNYSVVVMFTAMLPGRGCDMCLTADAMFSNFGDLWRYSPNFSNKLFLAAVDFDNAGEVFNKLKIETAPHFMHFPAEGRPEKKDMFEGPPPNVEALTQWIKQRTQIEIKVYKALNYSEVMVATFVVVIAVGLLCSGRINFLLCSSTTWGFVILTFVFVMCSGYMWLQIRGAPFSIRRKNGEQFISGKNGKQLVAETCIIALMYAGVSVGMLLVTWSANAAKSNRWLRRVIAVVGIGLVTVLFSAIVSIARIKLGTTYPYRGLFE